ncbi:hypothetical protein BCV70DRAFT_201806 [Testicularia cyperi]|uniref:Uncharacterized protein n=1 Tax=Testicularia cyperi TaxID=1882483 RepID=A0A317XJM2_9BASI|nr:hypothetical protein BCV70DRAFT_201806 [Testicularia cyperi]
MVAISGTYDVMLVPLLMPISHVLNFLPPQVRNMEPSPLIPFTSGEIQALGLDTLAYNSAANHPVMLELGYQDHSGPGPRLLRPSFDEAKLEVLGIRHPKLQQSQQPQVAHNGFQFKQLILFSNVVLATSSNIVAGLRSVLARIDPHKSPSIYPVGQDDTIQYGVKDYIEATFTKAGDGDASSSAANNGAVSWAGRPWYGWRVSDSVTQFNFNLSNPQIGPVPYTAEVRVKIPSFYDPSKLIEASSVSPDWVEFDGVSAWRFKADYASQDTKVVDAV